MDKELFASLLALGGVLLSGEMAQAQSTIPTVVAVNPGDLMQVIPNGVPSAQSKYGNVPVVTGVHGYSKLGIISTGSTFAYTNSIEFMIAQASSTTAAVTLTTSPNPGDGQHECYLNKATTTSLTVSAGAASQTVDASVATAGVANTPACWTFDAATATWYGSP